MVKFMVEAHDVEAEGDYGVAEVRKDIKSEVS